MILSEVYTRVLYCLFGDAQAYPTNIAVHLQGASGIIAQAHKQVQAERNYWFMQASTTLSVVDGTIEYDLPERWKAEISLRFKDTDGNLLEPLAKLTDEEVESNDLEKTETDYPSYYHIFNDHVYIYPTPAQNLTLYVKYWKFLAPPTTAGFLTHDDVLTQEGDECLIYLSTAKAALLIMDEKVATYYSNLYNEAKKKLILQDADRRNANYDFVRSNRMEWA